MQKDSEPEGVDVAEAKGDAFEAFKALLKPPVKPLGNGILKALSMEGRQFCSILRKRREMFSGLKFVPKILDTQKRGRPMADFETPTGFQSSRHLRLRFCIDFPRPTASKPAEDRLELQPTARLGILKSFQLLCSNLHIRSFRNTP